MTGIRDFFAWLILWLDRKRNEVALPGEDPSDEMISGPYSAAVVLGCAALAIGSVVALLCMVAAAAAHEAPSGWSYSSFCCNGGDCAQIDSDLVQVIPGGYRVTLAPGSHPMVTRPHVFDVEQAKALHSPDGEYHLCLWPTEDNLRCFYSPAMGF